VDEVPCALGGGEVLPESVRPRDLDQRVPLAPEESRGHPDLREFRRSVDLPQRAVEALRSHRKRQVEDTSLGSGFGWQDNGLVFPTTIGTPPDAQNIVNRHFKPLLRRAGLPDIRWHDLRHTCATLLLSRGTHPTYVQKLLGHVRYSSPSTATRTGCLRWESTPRARWTTLSKAATTHLIRREKPLRAALCVGVLLVYWVTKKSPRFASGLYVLWVFAGKNKEPTSGLEPLTSPHYE
jgi:Phage integrase family